LGGQAGPFDRIVGQQPALQYHRDGLAAIFMDRCDGLAQTLGADVGGDDPLADFDAQLYARLPLGRATRRPRPG
jgi:hypothetical protein